MRNVTIAACAALALTLAAGAYAQSPKSVACSHKQLAEEGGGNGGASSKPAEAGGGNGGAATQVAMAAPCP